MGKKRYTLVLNFGYVESAHTGYVPFTSKGTYKDAKEALVDLANYLKEKYLIEHGNKPKKKCCLATLDKDAAAKFCTKCGYQVIDYEFDLEDFGDWTRKLDTDLDTFGGLVEWDDQDRWEAGLLEGAPNQRFVYQANWVIPAVFGYKHQDGHSFEDICKRRTKSKEDCFKYY